MFQHKETEMRTISLKQDIEQVVLQYVRAIPEVFSAYDIAKVELVVQNNYDGLVFDADIVFVESDETELVIGDLTLGTDLSLDIEIYPDEDELELTLDQIFAE
jgi:hypothetical protein